MREKIVQFFGMLFFISFMSALTLVYYKISDYHKTYVQIRNLKEQVIHEEKGERKIDWDKMKGLNVVGWVKCGKFIDYPIVQGKDNSYYLTRDFCRRDSFNGSIFMNAHNAGDFTDNNTIIYGHNMKTGMMFGTLSRYLNKAYTKKHEFYIYRPDGTKHTYLFYSGAETQYDSVFYDTVFATEEEYKKYQKKIIQLSVADFKVKPDSQKRMVTLSTCASHGSSSGKRVCLSGIEYEVKKTQKAAKWYH